MRAQQRLRVWSIVAVGLMIAVALGVAARRVDQAESSSRASHDAVGHGSRAVNVSVGCGADVVYPAPQDTHQDGDGSSDHEDDDDAAASSTPRFSTVFANPLAEFISLHFEYFQLPPDDYIVVRPTNAKGKDRSRVTIFGTDHSASTSSTATGFFSRALFANSVTLELYTNTSSARNKSARRPAASAPRRPCWGFRVDAYRFHADGAHFEGANAAGVRELVCGADDTDEAACLRRDPVVFKRADTVARLLIHKDGASYFCTGWLFGCEGHVLTNHHCVSNSLHAANTEFEFRAQGKACTDRCDDAFACRGKTRATTARLVAAHEALDYALLHVEGRLHREYGFLQMREGGPALGEPIYMPSHPAGWGKRIAMKDDGQLGKVTALGTWSCVADAVGYFLDTQGGSSGSPVLSSRDHAVVALHNCGGCPNTGVNAGKIIADLRAKELLPKCAVYEPPDAPFDRHDDRGGGDANDGDDEP